jgi:hypothetical protein
VRAEQPAEVFPALGPVAGPGAQPPCVNDQYRPATGYRYSWTRWNPSRSIGITSAKSRLSTTEYAPSDPSGRSISSTRRLIH